MKEMDLLQRKEAREDCISRIEVLDKVGELLLLPNTEYATTKQVAEYYGVGVRAITSLVFDNKDEVVSDGYKVMKGKELENTDVISFKEFTKNRANYKFTMEDGSILSVGGGGVGLFPKRAILRVGMLLRDSEVAKEIRTRLLDIVHDASKQNNNEETIVENVVNEISEEKQLMLDRIEAEMNGDFETVCVINAKLFALKNKRIEELETEVENITTHALDIIESRKVINCLVRNIAVVKYGGKFGNAYNELYKKLNYQLGININARKQKNKLDSLSEEEMYKTEEIVRAWANDCGIDINNKLSLRA